MNTEAIFIFSLSFQMNIEAISILQQHILLIWYISAAGGSYFSYSAHG